METTVKVALGALALLMGASLLATRPSSNDSQAAKPAQTRLQLATLSTDHSHRVVKDASHPGLITDEHYAKATTQAILDVVTSVRNNEPLAK